MAIDLGYDESGDSKDTLLVSAQIGIAEQAKKLRRAWLKRLPRDLPYFHACDFGNYTGGIFTKAGLPRKERDPLLRDLCELIHRRLVAGVTVRISVSEYERLTTQDFRSRHGTAYAFAVDLCLLGAYAIAKEHGLRADFNILIEDGHRNANQAAQIMAGLKNIPDRVRESEKLIPDLRILTAGLGSKRDHPILQSADMLAYANWQKLSGRDLAIYHAVHRSAVSYYAKEANCDEELIREFANSGATPFIKRQRKRARTKSENA